MSSEGITFQQPAIIIAFDIVSFPEKQEAETVVVLFCPGGCSERDPGRASVYVCLCVSHSERHVHRQLILLSVSAL